MRYFCFLLFALFLGQTAVSAQENLNVYVWSGEIPISVIRQFEKETGIKVNFETYSDNETLYAKLKAAGNIGYDIIEPSSYYVDRMRREGMLLALDKTKIVGLENIDPALLNKPYDPHNQYSVPYVWGVTGIFFNQRYYPSNSINRWQDLWQPRFRNQLLMLNDPREVFSMALMTLGYSINDTDPQHIEQAYLKLKSLLPNIKIFNSGTFPSIVIDEDVRIGMGWNGDIFKAVMENSHIRFIYPEDGFVVWVDNFAIAKGARNLNNAYKFLNFMLQGKIAAQGTLKYHYASANQAAHDYLPEELRTNQLIFPDKKTLARGQFQTDVGNEALALYAHYWQLLKLNG